MKSTKYKYICYLFNTTFEIGGTCSRGYSLGELRDILSLFDYKFVCLIKNNIIINILEIKQTK